MRHVRLSGLHQLEAAARVRRAGGLHGCLPQLILPLPRQLLRLLHLLGRGWLGAQRDKASAARLTSVLVYMWEGMDGRVRRRGGRNLKRGDCVADRAPIAPSCTRAAAASGTYTLREREGHRPRLQGTAIRVAPSWHSALSQHRETRRRCARVPPEPKWNCRCRADRCVKCSAEQVQ